MSTILRAAAETPSNAPVCQFEGGPAPAPPAPRAVAPVSLTGLPDDMLLEVFARVKSPASMLAVSQTCSEMRRAVGTASRSARAVFDQGLFGSMVIWGNRLSLADWEALARWIERNGEGLDYARFKCEPGTLVHVDAYYDTLLTVPVGADFDIPYDDIASAPVTTNN